MSALQGFNPWAAIGKRDPAREAVERALDDQVERAEREAIVNEPELPPPGTEARRVIDLAHERMVRGLIAAARSPPQ
jgi:hypothetical protein